MRTETIKKVKDSIEKMPPLSPVVHKIVQVTNDITSSAGDLTEVIQMDPVLMARLIKMVNSAYFGLPEEIKSIKQAVVMLGVNTLKNVALSSTLVGNMSLKKNSPLDGEAFWKHSFAVGTGAKLIARRAGVDPKFLEEYFVAGLMHDIGKVLINNFFPDDMENILKLASEQKHPLLKIEKHILGLTHEEIGIAIGKKWRFNNNYLYSVGKHHEPVLTGGSAKFSMVVAIANSFVNSSSADDRAPVKAEPPGHDMYTTLNIEPSDIEEAMTDLGAEIEKARVFLQ